MRVHLDFETRSVIDLKRAGLYVYAAHPSTEVLCAAYAIDEGPVSLWLRGDPVPRVLVLALLEEAEWHAWNAQFERVIWRDVWARPGQPMHAYGCPDLKEWHCSMAQAALHGLPLGLAQAAAAVGVPERKNMGGRAVMLSLCQPYGFTPSGEPLWREDPEKTSELGRYCQNDVLVERSIMNRLYPMPAAERAHYLLDQVINERGVMLDRELAEASRVCAKKTLDRLEEKLLLLTDGHVRSANQVAELSRWLASEGVPVDTLAAGAVEEMLQSDLPVHVGQVLEIRRDAAKSSVAKVESMIWYASESDHRMRGLLQFSGAATGRWAGRGPQPHNFPRGTVADVEQFIPQVLARDVDAIDLYAPVMDVLSSLLRAHIVAADGHVLMAGDFNAIEARVLAWLAGQNDVLDMFRNGEDVYVDMAAKIYIIARDAVSKKQRAFGKVAVLGLGYQMGRVTFRDSCAAKGILITEEFAEETVHAYRASNEQITHFWSGLNEAAIEAVRHPRNETSCRRIRFLYTDDWLQMILPSGRSLYYAEPRVRPFETPWGDMRDTVVCYSYSTMTRQWTPRKIYGGLWTENAVQAVARDILADAMQLLEHYGFPVVLTVHDEIVSEIPEADADRLPTFERLMREPPDWARGCPIAVEAWAGKRYRK